MALTIQQRPTTPNQANADLLYVLTTTNINQPQFQFVMEVGGVTLKQQPSPSQKGVFNIGQITLDLVSQNNNWKTIKYSTATSSFNSVTPMFYEEYGTSESSSVSYNNGLSGSALYIMNGVVNPNDGSFNFLSSSYMSGTNRLLTNSPDELYCRDNEFATLSMLNGHYAPDKGFSDVYSVEYKVYNGSTLVQSASVFNTTQNGGGPRTNSQTNLIYPYVSSSITNPQRLLTIGSGVENIQTIVPAVTASTTTKYEVIGKTVVSSSFGLYRFEICGAASPPEWESEFTITGSQYQVGRVYYMYSDLNQDYSIYNGIYTCVDFTPTLIGNNNQYGPSVSPRPGVNYYTACDQALNDDGDWTEALEALDPTFTTSSIFTKTYEIQQKECGYDGTRFAFVNSFGVFDYITFPFADSKQDTIERQTYEQGFVNYSTTTNSVTYDKSRRGTKVFSLKTNETRTAQSDYLTQEEADWLSELIDSTEVYIQEGSDFIPIVIQTADFVYKTNPRSQKLYTLNISYKLANQKREK
jgi:hypothetical protein